MLFKNCQSNIPTDIWKWSHFTRTSLLRYIYAVFREQLFLILDTVVEDFWPGYETFLLSCGATKILRAIFMGYKTILLEKISMKSSIKD